MTAITEASTGVAVKSITPLFGANVIQVILPATFVWATDTFAIDLTKHGASKCLGVLAFEETTAGSVTVAQITAAAPTTAVSSGTLTITTSACGAGTYGGSFVIFVA